MVVHCYQQINIFYGILINFYLAFHFWNTFMGCQTSRQEGGELAKNNQALRRNNKKADKIIGRISENAAITENVVQEEEKIGAKDQGKIGKIIAPHFFFSSFSENERTQIIEHMNVYKCAKDQYIFKQADPGSLFFIIKKGKVSIQINGRHVKDMEKGECFGELSLLYTAPRSASVRTLTDCVFWGLHQTVFKSYTEEMVRKNYKIAKPFLQKVPLFQFLSSNQINSIAYSMNSLKYNANQNIFKEGDDANSFYIVIEGQVRILIRGKDPIILPKGESFGQNSFKKSQVRSGTAIAGPNSAKLLSIGREGLLKCLGNNIEQLIQFNILKWALKRSKIFANIPSQLIKKFIQISQIKQCSDNEIICKKKDALKYLIVCIEGKVEQYDVGVLINEEYILEATATGAQKDKQIFLKSNLKKFGKGNVCLLPIKKIEGLLQLNLIQATRKNQDIFKEFSIGNQVNFMAKTKRKLNITLNDLIYEKNLGEGQFGKVFLVRNKNGTQRFALKCIKKKAVIEMGLQKMIRNEKQILQSTNHPLIVRLEETFKDQAFLYLLMQYVDGIDFFDMLREIGLCNVEHSCFYLACLILCVQELHSHNIVYRDLKPENAVVDSKGFLYMIDLGTAKKLNQDKGNRTFTIIGTPHYMAPQIIEGKGYGLEVDVWSLGVMLYEMVCGKLPFGEDNDDPYCIYKQIMSQKIQYPHFYYNKKGKVLIQRLLERNSLKRQIQDFEVIKRDPYFEQFKWEDLYSKKMKPPTAPKKKKESNTKFNEPILKHLAKDIRSEAVKEPTPWDEIF